MALRDADAAKRLFRNGVSDLSRPQPGVIDTDLAPIYGLANADIKKEGTLRSRCRHRPVQYLNNIVEQDHRAIKRRVNAKQRFREFQAARRTIQDEAMHAGVAKPDTILAWYRRLVAEKFDGSQHRQYPGRPSVQPDVEALVGRMARENTGWGYDRIVGALTNLGHHLSDQTVGNILRGHGIAQAPKRRRTTSWKDFISAHMEPSRQRGRYYQTSGSRVDAANRPQCDPGDLGLPSCMPLYSARSRHEVLRIVSVGAGGWRRETIPLPARSV